MEKIWGDAKSKVMMSICWCTRTLSNEHNNARRHLERTQNIMVTPLPRMQHYVFKPTRSATTDAKLSK